MRTTRTNVIPLLPADYREAVMLQHAGDALAAARDVFIDGDPFNIDTMHAQVRHMLKMLAEDHERNMARVVELALAGAEDAHEALLDLKAGRWRATSQLRCPLRTRQEETRDVAPSQARYLQG